MNYIVSLFCSIEFCYFSILRNIGNSLISLFNIIRNSLFTLSNNYDDLLIELIGGEIALITIFFTLLPIILDNSKGEFYLGYKLSDVFLYGKSNKNKMIKTWIIGISIIIINSYICYLKYSILGFLFFIVFLIFITYNIISYLKFISDKSKILEQIESTADYELVNNCDNFINTLVDSSQKSINDFNTICNYLSNKENKSYFEKYINGVIDETTINKKNIYLKISEIMKKEKYNLKINIDLAEFYKFIKNNVNDNNLEDFYELIYIMIINNYNNYKENENIQHLFLIIWDAIDESNLTKGCKHNFKKRMLNNSIYYINKGIKIEDKEYYNIYSYVFMIVKKIISDRDPVIFKKFLNMNSHIDYNTDELMVDVFFSCYAYFYYLIEKEVEKYVGKEDKKIFKDMYIALKEKIDIYEFLCFKHYYDNLDLFILNLEKISDNTWEIFDYSDEYDVKFCKVYEIILNFKRVLYLIFKVKNTVDNNRYVIDEQIVNCFKFEMKKGKINADLLSEIKRISEFIEYDYDRLEIEKFELDFIKYVSQTFKQNELNKKIDKQQLIYKLNSEVNQIESEINKLEIVNDKKCVNSQEINYFVTCSKSYLDSVINNKNIMSELEITKGFEKHICNKINDYIQKKVFYSYNEEKKVIDVLNSIEGNNCYIVPVNDRFIYRQEFAQDYKKILEKYKVLKTNCYNIRFIIQEYNCKLIKLSFSVEEIDKTIIEKKKKDLFISSNKYCIKDSNGLEIFLTNKEIEQYLKNNEVVLKFNIKYGLDISNSKNNTSFIINK